MKTEKQMKWVEIETTMFITNRARIAVDEVALKELREAQEQCKSYAAGEKKEKEMYELLDGIACEKFAECKLINITDVREVEE